MGIISRSLRPSLLVLTVAAALIAGARSWDPAAADHLQANFASDSHIGYEKDDQDVSHVQVFIPGTDIPYPVIYSTADRVKEVAALVQHKMVAIRSKASGDEPDLILHNLDPNEDWDQASLRAMQPGVTAIGGWSACADYIFYAGLNAGNSDLFRLVVADFTGPASFAVDNLTGGIPNDIFDPHCHNAMLTFALEAAGQTPGTIARLVYSADLAAGTGATAFSDTLSNYCVNPVAIGAMVNGGYLGQIAAFCQPALPSAEIGQAHPTLFKAWDFETGVQTYSLDFGSHIASDLRDLDGWASWGLYTYTAPDCFGQQTNPTGRDLCLFDATTPPGQGTFYRINASGTDVSWYYIAGNELTYRLRGEEDWYRGDFDTGWDPQDLINSIEPFPGTPGGEHWRGVTPVYYGYDSYQTVPGTQRTAE